MADYRQIAQDYAREAIKGAVLINAGAAVALLSQATGLIASGLADDVSTAMVCWASGVFLASATWILAFLSARYVDKAEAEKSRAHLVTSDYLMIGGIIGIVLSLVMFMVGCTFLALGFGEWVAP